MSQRVSDPTSSSAVRIAGVDALTPEQRSFYDQYRSVIGGGVCVNVMIGRDDWDVRPLMLEQGRVWLYRMTPILSGSRQKIVAAELEGFCVIPHWEMRIRSAESLNRVLVTRPYVQSTVTDLLKSGDLDRPEQRKRLAREIIEQVRTLLRRNLVHGHIAPQNIALSSGKVVLLDPGVGVLMHHRDEYVAPEIASDVEPEQSADLFSLGRVLKVILSDIVTAPQKELIEQMMLPAPRQRPPFSTVYDTFSVSAPDARPTNVPPTGPMRPGKVITGSDRRGSLLEIPEVSPSEPLKNTSSVQLPGRSFRPVLGAVLALLFGLIVIRLRFPATYYAIAHVIPLLAPDRDAQYDADWRSGSKPLMQSVAQRAIQYGEPAAENAIINDILAGNDPPLVTAGLMREAFDPLWYDQLSRRDRRAVLILTLAQLAPEGVKDLPPLSELHPAIVLAVAGQVPPNNPGNQLKGVPLSRVVELPDPVGPLFGSLGGLGVKTLGEPEAIGLAGIVSGKPSPAAIEAYVGDQDQIEKALARIAIVLPVISARADLANQLFVTVRDKGGVLGQALSWFDIEELPKWSSVSPSAKLSLLLGQLSQAEFSLEQYSDLLLFPLPRIRHEAAQVLQDKFLKKDSASMLALLSSDQNRLTRAQNIALLAAIHLDSEAKGSFLTAWFQTKPNPDMVAILLMSRANLDSKDVFNLEAARYLKMVAWKGGVQALSVLARHPEPLARSIAYTLLDPGAKDQLMVLAERAKVETDPGLKQALALKIESFRKPTVKPSPTAKVD